MSSPFFLQTTYRAKNILYTPILQVTMGDCNKICKGVTVHPLYPML